MTKKKAELRKPQAFILGDEEVCKNQEEPLVCWGFIW